MKIKVQNNSLVIVSEIDTQLFRDAEQYAPQSLTVKDEKGTPVFRAMVGNAELKEFGISFNAVVGGKLAVTEELPMGIKEEDAQEYIKTFYAKSLASLATYEAKLVAQMEAALAPIAVVMDTITYEE